MQNKPTTLCWFPWYPKDWITSDSVGRMTDDQIVAYIFLLNRQWLCENGRLPEEVELLSKYAMHDMSQDKMACVLDRFPVHPEGGRANERLYDIYIEQQEKHQKRVDSANKRWGNNPMQPALDDAMHIAKHMHSASGSVSGSVSDSVSQEGESEGGDALRNVTKPKKLEFGEFKNVKLTEAELGLLISIHGNPNVYAGIEVLSAWLESSGKRKKNHYACLNRTSWVWEEMKKKGLYKTTGSVKSENEEW